MPLHLPLYPRVSILHPLALSLSLLLSHPTRERGGDTLNPSPLNPQPFT